MKKLQISRTKLAMTTAVALGLAGWTSLSVGQQARPAPGRTAQPAQAQPARPATGQPARTAPGAAQGEIDHMDQHVAQCLILENRNEVAAARIAEKKGNNDEVKNFAENIAKDHEQFSADLEKFAGNNYRHGPGTTTTVAAPGAEGKAPANPVAPATARDQQPRDGAHHMARFMKIHEEIADQCRASVQRELDAKQGKAFDECFMGMQIVNHMKLVDELTVLSRHVSPELRPVLDKGLQTAQRHLDNAKQVMKDMNDSRTADAKEVRSQ